MLQRLLQARQCLQLRLGLDEASVRAAKEEAERILAHRGEKMEVAEAQQRLAEVSAQLQALERLRKNLKH